MYIVKYSRWLTGVDLYNLFQCAGAGAVSSRERRNTERRWKKITREPWRERGGLLFYSYHLRAWNRLGIGRKRRASSSSSDFLSQAYYKPLRAVPSPVFEVFCVDSVPRWEMISSRALSPCSRCLLIDLRFSSPRKSAGMLIRNLRAYSN